MITTIVLIFCAIIIVAHFQAKKDLKKQKENELIIEEQNHQILKKQKEDELKLREEMYKDLLQFTEEIGEQNLKVMEENILEGNHYTYTTEYNKLKKFVFLYQKYGNEIANILYEQKWFIGMTEEMLLDSKGEPTKIEIEQLKTKIKSKYIYGNKTSGDIFDFVNGKLEKFKDR